MTRNLAWTGFITVDGAMDSPGGTREGHPGGGWVFDTEFLMEAYSLKGEELADTSALVFGRHSYEAFAAVWPRSPDHVAYKELPKYVVSSTLADDALVEGWGPTTILRSTDEVAALKQQKGGNLYIHGSGELARRLAAAGLIDQYNLLMFPYLLGAGKRPFDTSEHARQKLQLRESEAYANGVVKLVYDVVA